ncbi:hypothetical protein FH972_023795 [Carpinus fangiana]|uniref:GS catalytic domain-containing protein n=1 Tax=Carpinus fangiana TaxID=176857 RepID=A0A5N6KW83_9ROSI|nr:hypothetical protein FH972_023795 [Carpinus fangiana]
MATNGSKNGAVGDSEGSNAMIGWKNVQTKFDPEFVWIRFMPYNGVYMLRMLPVKAFDSMMKRGERISISANLIFVTRLDHIAANEPPVGALYLEPDWTSAYAHPDQKGRRVEIMSTWVDDKGSLLEECPRGTLSRMVKTIQDDYGIDIWLGFEIEVVLLGSAPTSTGPRHGCFTMAPQDEDQLPLIEEIVRAMTHAGVQVVQFHAEAAPCQWEFVLHHDEPLGAVDQLVRARRALIHTAHAHGVHATFHPRPSVEEAGTASHMHISANPRGGGAGTQEHVQAAEAFFAGILEHLQATMAFSYPLSVSYDRVKPGIWSGGEYVCWGWQNREVPLRRISPNRFEVKAVCATANPYLAASALLAAGLDGLGRSLVLQMQDCQVDASTLSDAQRVALGIHNRLPTSLAESLAALSRDHRLRAIIGERLVRAYAAQTQEHDDQLQAMSVEERCTFLLANY